MSDTPNSPGASGDQPPVYVRYPVVTDMVAEYVGDRPELEP